MMCKERSGAWWVTAVAANQPRLSLNLAGRFAVAAGQTFALWVMILQKVAPKSGGLPVGIENFVSIIDEQAASG